MQKAIYDKSDSELDKIIQTHTKLLSDKTLLQRLPDKGEKLRIQLEQAHKELSTRELIKASVTKLENLTLNQDAEMEPTTKEFSAVRSEIIDNTQKPLSVNRMNKVRNAEVKDRVEQISMAESLLLSTKQLKFPHQPPNKRDETNSISFIKFRDAEPDSDDDLGCGHDCDDNGSGNDCDDLGGGNDCDDLGGGNDCDDLGGGNDCDDNGENNDDYDYYEDYD